MGEVLSNRIEFPPESCGVMAVKTRTAGRAMSAGSAKARRVSIRGVILNPLCACRRDGRAPTILKAALVLLLWPAALTAPSVLGTLRGRITDGSGAPVAKALVALIPAQGKARLATSDANGEYAIGDIEPGFYTIWATEGNISRFDRANLGVMHGQIETIDITLGAGPRRQSPGLSSRPGPPLEFAALRGLENARWKL